MIFVHRRRDFFTGLAALIVLGGGVNIAWAQADSSPVPIEQPEAAPMMEEPPLEPLPDNSTGIDAVSELPASDIGEDGVAVPIDLPNGEAPQNPAETSAMAAPPAVQPLNQLQKPLTQIVNKRQGPVFDRDKYPSMLFTFWEHTAIVDARRARGLTRAPTESELMRDLKTDQEDVRVKPPPEEREIKLSGILYQGGKDWTIWLNGERVTPNAIPEEVMDLKVYSNYIEFKWFDLYTNQIFPIRLRPHQRFNIDTRIFLPG